MNQRGRTDLHYVPLYIMAECSVLIVLDADEFALESIKLLSGSGYQTDCDLDWKKVAVQYFQLCLLPPHPDHSYFTRSLSLSGVASGLS